MKVAYFVGEFPLLSETFIVAEIADHVVAGLNVEVFSYGSGPRTTLTGHIGESLRDRVTYLGLGGGSLSLIGRMMAEALRHPRTIASAVRAAWLCRRYRQKLALRTIAVAMKLSRLLPGFQVLHCHFGPRGSIGAVAVKASRLPLAIVTTFHGYDVASARFHPLQQVYAGLMAHSDLCLTVNELWHYQLIAAGFDPDKVRVSHMGVDLSRLRYCPRDDGNQGTLRLALVGRLTAKKGHFSALDALAGLRARRPQLAVRLDCVGAGPLHQQIKARIAQLSLGGVVRMLGPLDHEAALEVIARADAFVLPSLTAPNGDMEGIPVALMEAMALGRPVISTQHSGIPELVDDGISGLLAEEGNSAQIATAIARLADDLHLRNSLANEARAKVEKEFDLSRIGAWLRRQYRGLALANGVDRAVLRQLS
ncbi:MAG: glycosyltransferase [Sphingomicrobium sp.]